MLTLINCSSFYRKLIDDVTLHQFKQFYNIFFYSYQNDEIFFTQITYKNITFILVSHNTMVHNSHQYYFVSIFKLKIFRKNNFLLKIRLEKQKLLGT